MGIRFFGGSCVQPCVTSFIPAGAQWLADRVNIDMALFDRRTDYTADSRPLVRCCAPTGQRAASRSARYRTRVSPSRCRRAFSRPAIGTRFWGAREESL